jgi:hypothetical protein
MFGILPHVKFASKCAQRVLITAVGRLDFALIKNGDQDGQ